MTLSRNHPLALGYRMPAEWEPHAATWIAWPHHEADWPGKLSTIALVYTEIVRQLAASEQVEILVNDIHSERRARRALGEAGVVTKGVRFHRWPTNRVWTRDSGPIFVRNREGLAVTDWKFNAWAKYPNWRLDNMLPGRVAGYLRLCSYRPVVEVDGRLRRVVLEGGSIDVNGWGSLLTTEECLLSRVQQRNPGVSRDQIEGVFREYLGVTNTLWLGGGIVGDDTHGHVDDIARFVASDTVVAAWEPRQSDPNHAPLRENLRRLRRARDERGRRLRVIELPMPAAIHYRGVRLPASYLNFYIAKRSVLVPVFNDPNDRVALNTMAQIFRERQIVPIYCGDLIWGFGAIHCMTQQQPAV